MENYENQHLHREMEIKIRKYKGENPKIYDFRKETLAGNSDRKQLEPSRVFEEAEH